MNTNNNDTDRGEARLRYIKYGIISLAVLLVIGITAGIILWNSNSYVATVGNEKVSKAEYSFYLAYTKSMMLQSAQSAATSSGSTFDEKAFWNTKIDGESAAAVAKKKALEMAKEVKVQAIKARESNVSLDKSEITQVDTQISDYVKQYGNKTKANEALKQQYGINTSELRTILRENSLVQKFSKAQVNAIKVSDQDFKTFYDKNTDKFKSSTYRTNGEEAVWARHILILVNTPQTDSKATEQQKADAQKKADAEAKKKAEDVLVKVQKGEDFTALAKEYSEDTATKDVGGQYVFGKGKMEPAFEQAAFALEPGKTSGLVKTSYGYHIIKLEEKIAKDQPISLKGAKEYWEYGVNAVKSWEYQAKLDSWKDKYPIKTNDKVYNSIK